MSLFFSLNFYRLNMLQSNFTMQSWDNFNNLECPQSDEDLKIQTYKNIRYCVKLMIIYLAFRGMLIYSEQGDCRNWYLKTFIMETLFSRIIRMFVNVEHMINPLIYIFVFISFYFHFSFISYFHFISYLTKLVKYTWRIQYIIYLLFHKK